MTNMAINVPPRSSAKAGEHGSWSARLTSIIRRCFAAVTRRQRIRRNMWTLQMMDDRSLADIGLHRSEIYATLHYGRPRHDASGFRRPTETRRLATEHRCPTTHSKQEPVMLQAPIQVREDPSELGVLSTVTHDIGRLVGVAMPFIDTVLGLARLRASSLGLLSEDAARGADLFSQMPRRSNQNHAVPRASGHIARTRSRFRRGSTQAVSSADRGLFRLGNRDAG
jgi:uncharacterized protein YjiS (DUF1127 family)